MDAALAMNIENGLILATLVLILTAVGMLTRLVKYKAKYVYQLHLLVRKMEKL